MNNHSLAAYLCGCAGLLLLTSPKIHAQLKIDFDERPNIVTAGGFNSFVLDPSSANTGTALTTTRTFTLENTGPISVSLGGFTAAGAAANVDDRIRTTPTNSASLSVSEIYRDFVFYSADRAEGSGLRLDLAGLAPNGEYSFTIYSFDSGSVGTRVSDWFANDTLVRDNYTFSGSVLPVSNDQYSFSFNATADENGSISILGKRDATSVNTAAAPEFGVFINAIEITAVPEPGTIALLGLAGLFVFARTRRTMK